MRSRTSILGVVAAALSVGACDKVPANAVQSCQAAQVTPGSVRTDILFVIDNSGSMAAEQAALQAALGEFITALSTSPVKDDFQIGVTTTSLDGAGAAGGSLVGVGIIPGSSPSLVPDFESAVLVGTGGSSWEQPFEAAKRAIEKSVAGTAPNAGFVRPGSRLAIFFMSDEDDCSAAGATPGPGMTPYCSTAKASGSLYPVSRYVDFLRDPASFGGEAKQVVVYAVAGFSPATLVLSCGNLAGTSTSCSDTTCSTAADEGDRFLALTQAFGTGGRIGSICSPDISSMLLEFAGVIMSQTMPLEGAPADPRMLVVTITKPTGEVVSCGTVATAGTPAAATANVVYTPPQPGSPASLSFQFDCALGHGYQVDVRVICAG